jgi:N6-L-threonylcarbamoyladenine synthase
MPAILGIESTCDETAAAVVVDGRKVRSSVISSQVDLHARFGGVVPEIASRAHIEKIIPVIEEALATASCKLAEIDAIAVAHRPGLIGSLLIGVTAAKTLAWATGKPLIGVDHVHAHLYSVVLETNEQPPMPAVGLVCSGGHTALYQINTWSDITLIGSTIDDAVGEAYDKVAAILGLGYPGGPIVDRLAQQGNGKAIRFPRSMLGRESLDFSFSGLKTAVLYHVRGVPGPRAKPTDYSEEDLPDVAASFQSACVDTIIEKLKRAVRRTKARSILVGGGVSANQGLRHALKSLPLPTLVPSLKYCMDNAAMSAGLACIPFQNGAFSDLALDAITFSQFRR